MLSQSCTRDGTIGAPSLEHRSNDSQQSSWDMTLAHVEAKNCFQMLVFCPTHPLAPSLAATCFLSPGWMSRTSFGALPDSARHSRVLSINIFTASGNTQQLKMELGDPQRSMEQDRLEREGVGLWTLSMESLTTGCVRVTRT